MDKKDHNMSIIYGLFTFIKIESFAYYNANMHIEDVEKSLLKEEHYASSQITLQWRNTRRTSDNWEISPSSSLTAKVCAYSVCTDYI